MWRAGASDKAQEVINRFHYAIAHAKKLKEVGKNEVTVSTAVASFEAGTLCFPVLFNACCLRALLI